MLIDAYNEFADAVAIPTAIATDNFGDLINLEVARDIGVGKPLYLVINVDTAVASAGSATVAFQLVSDATSTVSTTTQTVHALSAAFAKATLVAGYQIVLPVPPESPAFEQYLGVQAITAVATLTAGKVNAFLTTDPHLYKAYADAANG